MPGRPRKPVRPLTRAELELVERNRPLVIWAIRRWWPQWGDDEDLIQEGLCGLARAAQKFNPELGRITTYAIPWIRRAVLTAMREWGLVHIPPTKHHCIQLRYRSLDQPARSSEFKELTRATSRPANSAAALARVDLQRLLAVLPDRERRILEMHHGLDGQGERTLEAIGVALGLSRERVRQLEVESIAHIRGAFELQGRRRKWRGSSRKH